ncbi:hypothetical protein PVAG01_06368 [Phlyctema vagabunda]|uniref:Arrestin-like N-terminal domain-containing protein n=1 Tax=Phlyctema vagabunda TaxID=108571 RepID=A0ABR4PGI0_9HELO
MSAPSIQSSQTMASYARRLGQFRKPGMEIVIDNHEDHKVYTTFDAINGRVEITAPQTTRFDEIQIHFEGLTRTYVDSVSPASAKSRTTASHNFLRLVMPIRESEYPQPRIAEAGQTYTYPFNFVIPNQLLPTSCSHEREEDHVQQAHLQLPPSVGDFEVSGKDDMAPQMMRTTYSVRVQVVRFRETDGKKTVISEVLKKIRVIPASSEAPPMSISLDDHEYTMSKTKSLKKGVFSGKLGKITMSAAQTAPFFLPPPSATGTPATTMATVDLRFDPNDASSQPPRLGGLTSKLKVLSFFSVRPVRSIASRTMMSTDYQPTRGMFNTRVPLSSRCVENVSWKRHEPKHAFQRRGSDSSTSSSEWSDSTATSPKNEAKLYYTATIIVPLSLPMSKEWLPTFHTCIASRVYALEFGLVVHTPGAGMPASQIGLRLPVQIAALGEKDAPAALTPSEAAAELAQADEFLRPRVIEVPSEEHIGNSILPGVPELPPSYEDFSELLPQRTVASRS